MKVANEERDHVSKLADILFDLSQTMGSVIDYLLKDRGSKEPGQEPESTKVMLDVLLKQMEIQDSGISGGDSGSDSEIGSAKAAEKSS
jgi:hypothetical protein